MSCLGKGNDLVGRISLLHVNTSGDACLPDTGLTLWFASGDLVP